MTYNRCIMRYEILCEVLMRSKLPFLLIATGISVPLVSVPFADGYRRNTGVIENIQSMSFFVWPEAHSPDFRAIDLPNAAATPFELVPEPSDLDFERIEPDTRVEYGNGINIYFPKIDAHMATESISALRKVAQ